MRVSIIRRYVWTKASYLTNQINRREWLRDHFSRETQVHGLPGGINRVAEKICCLRMAHAVTRITKRRMCCDITRSTDYFLTLAKTVCLKSNSSRMFEAFARDILYATYLFAPIYGSLCML